MTTKVSRLIAVSIFAVVYLAAFYQVAKWSGPHPVLAWFVVLPASAFWGMSTSRLWAWVKSTEEGE